MPSVVRQQEAAGRRPLRRVGGHHGQLLGLGAVPPVAYRTQQRPALLRGQFLYQKMEDLRIVDAQVAQFAGRMLLRQQAAEMIGHFGGGASASSQPER